MGSCVVSRCLKKNSLLWGKMAENAYEVLKGSSPSLIEFLDKNHDVCDFLMSFYKHVQVIAIDSPNEPKDMVCFVDIVMERLLKISVQYYNPSNRNSSFGEKLPAKRNLNIVKLMEVNHNVRDVAVRVATVLQRWLKEKPERIQQGFENIKIVNPMQWKGGTFTAELVLYFEFEDFVSARLKFDMNSKEQPTEEEVEQEKKVLELGEDFVNKDLEWRK